MRLKNSRAMRDAQAPRCDAGYAMAALLVAMALMAIFMSVALPAWRHATQREREAELVWRGEQYDRAIQLFRRKYAAPGPPNLDILLEQKFLRKKYKDPITGGDFELKPVGQAAVSPTPGVIGRGGQQGQRREPRRQARQPGQQPRAQGQLIGGVRSKSTEKSIRVLNGRDRYNQWEFTYVPYTANPAPTGGTPGAQPGQQRPGVQPSRRGSRSGQRSPGVSPRP
jgi:type II secretory pathway pseudopilin PulG